MRRFREIFLILIFPVIYILTDVMFRYKHIIYYTYTQMLFYIISVLFTLLLFSLVIIAIRRNENRPAIKYTAGVLAAFYYTAAIFGSYVFMHSTGIFPNFYTFTYFKNEPSSSFSLLKDSIHTWQVIVFTAVFVIFFYYFNRVSRTEIFRTISLKTKPLLPLSAAAVLLAVLVINIHKSDQCMIVDANFTADVSRHISGWKESTTYSGDGLPSRYPVKLSKTGRKADFNVLLIVFESLRSQNMQIYGYGRETTPFLKSLEKSRAGNLYIFRNAYTVSTTTMLAVPAILTGVTPEQPRSFFESFPFVWEYARMLNYTTFFISSQRMQWYRFDRYYSLNRPDFYWNSDNSGLPAFNDSGTDDRLTTEKLNSHISDISDSPFFGVMQYNTTHFPYNVPEENIKWDEKYIDRYDNSVLHQDGLLEKVFLNLSRLDLLKNTVVIMAGDHGEAFKEHNSIGHIDIYNTETVSIPILIYVPAGTGSRINSAQLKLNTLQNVSNADITPTIINLLGLRNNRQVASVYPLFTGRNLLEPLDNSRGIITFNSSELVKFNSGISLIKDNYHYILRTNIVPYRREFYNMKTDPYELNNIIKTTGEEILSPLHLILSRNKNSGDILRLFFPEYRP